MGGGSEAARLTQAPWLTPVNVAIGTADYSAPEECLDARRADIRADIYSLGCTLYRMLAGRVPFPGGPPEGKVRRHRDEPPRPLRDIRPDVPEKLARVVARMLAKDPAARFQTPAEVVDALALCATTRITHIMVVDDDADTRSSMATLLKLHDVFVTTAENGRDALAKLRQGPLPGLILLDLRMPVMDGWQFLQERQHDAAVAHVPVILMSGANPDQVRCFRQGVADYLQKPINVEDLTAKIHDYAG